MQKIFLWKKQSDVFKAARKKDPDSHPGIEGDLALAKSLGGYPGSRRRSGQGIHVDQHEQNDFPPGLPMVLELSMEPVFAVVDIFFVSKLGADAAATLGIKESLMTIVHSFNGAGDTATPTSINFFCFWLLEISLAYVLATPQGLEEKGVYTAVLAAETMMTLVVVVLSRRGRWKIGQV